MVIDPREFTAFGRWKVTTEGDCEGKSIKHLGTWEGFVDEIALHLAKDCYYSLHFEKLEDLPNKLPQTSDEVSVSFHISSGTWNLSPEERANIIAEAFKDRPVEVLPGQYYASVKLRPKMSEEERKNREIQKILDKLTEKQRELLQEYYGK